MKHFIFLAVMAAFVVFPARAISQDTGVELQKECQAVGTTQPNHESYMKSAHCLGYVAGVAAVVKLWEQTNREKNFDLQGVPACLLDSTTNEEFVRVVLRYLDAHPGNLQLNYSLLILLALGDAYPCSKVRELYITHPSHPMWFRST